MDDLRYKEAKQVYKTMVVCNGERRRGGGRRRRRSAEAKSCQVGVAARELLIKKADRVVAVNSHTDQGMAKTAQEFQLLVIVAFSKLSVRLTKM